MDKDSDGRTFRVLERRLLALLLSFLSPGLGQVYNQQLLRGALFYALTPAYLEGSSLLGLPHTFRGMVVHVAVGLLLFVLITIDAVRTAGRRAKTTIPSPHWQAYILAVCMLFLTAAAFAGNVIPDHIPGVHEYEIIADSMAPTLKKGDRVIVDMRYYNSHAPRRGDVVVIAVPPTGTLMVKRVVAVAGDVIKADPRSTMINGQTIPEPYLGSVSDEEKAHAESSLTFGPVTVPADQVFVLGDNRCHSLDSRYFGPIAIDQIKGKVLYFYWSPIRSRIGEEIQ